MTLLTCYGLTMKNCIKFFLIAALFLLGFSAQFAYAAADLPTPVGRVVWVKGVLRATMQNNEVRLLQKASIIYLHDTLSTDDKSQAQIGFTDNSLMTFQANTKLFISEYEFKPKVKNSVGKYILNLIEGGFRTITGMVAKKNPNNYSVNSPVATIGVRGTEYRAYYHNGRLGVGWYKGTPCVTTFKKSKTICLSKDLQYVEVPEPDSAPVPLKERPDYFGDDLLIEVVNIDGFDIYEGSTRTRTIYRNSNSFCITN